MALYTHTTFAQAKSAIRARLGQTFWTDHETGLYLREGLRWWGSLTHRWRDRLTEQLVQNQHWYAVAALFPSQAPTVLDQDLLEEIQHHLLEDISRTSWPGTSQFTLDEVTQGLQSYQDFLLAQPLSLAQTLHNVPLAPRFSLAGISPTRAILNLRRVAWKATDGTFTHLRKADEDQARYYDPGWSLNPDTPEAFSLAVTPQLELAFIPSPNTPGQLELVYQLAGPVLNPAAGVVLGLPDALSWGVKWGAIADLLAKEGASADPQRQRYAAERFEESLLISELYSFALEAELNGRLTNLSSVYDLDSYRSEWQNEAAAEPDAIAFMGYNLFSVAPKPDAGPNSVLFDAIVQAPIPTDDADHIQLGKDELDAVIDYAHHIGSFKQGGDEFMSTMALYQGAQGFAAELNGRLKAAITARAAMEQRAREEDRKRIMRGAPETRVPRVRRSQEGEEE